MSCGRIDIQQLASQVDVITPQTIILPRALDWPIPLLGTIGLSMPPDPSTAVEELYRSDWGRIVATLIRLVGDFDLAEEVAQEAFTVAVDQWRTSGVPELPRAWIIKTAHNKAIDRIRRRQN